LALALVRDPRDHRVPVNEEDLVDFETDMGAPVQICGIADAVSPGHGASDLVLAGCCRVAAGCCIGKHLGQLPTVASSRPVILGRYEGRPRGYVDRQHHAG
jgi:hypothetical protein